MLLLQVNETTQGIDPAAAAAVGFAFITLLIIMIVVFILNVIAWIGLWTASSKAGHFGLWACIPIVQFFIWSLMGGKPAWWGLLMLVPVVNIVVLVIIIHNISLRFDRGVGTTLGLMFLPFIFWPILGLGSAQYNANAA